MIKSTMRTFFLLSVAGAALVEPEQAGTNIVLRLTLDLVDGFRGHQATLRIKDFHVVTK